MLSAGWTTETFIVERQGAQSKSRIINTLSYRAHKRNTVKKLAEVNPTAFHALDYISLDVAATAKQKLGGKLVFDACEVFTDTAYATPATTAYIHKVFVRHKDAIDAVLTPSANLKDFYSQNYPDWPAAQIVSNAPDLELTQPYDGRLHKTLGVSGDTRILLYHGGFSSKRGLSHLVESAHSLPENHILVLMGWGALESNLKAAALTTNRIAKRSVVRFLGPVPNIELFNWISGATYGLIPYEAGPLNHAYCTPNKLYEFPAAGVPVIATDLPTLDQYIRGGMIGVTVSDVVGSELSKTIAKISDQDHKIWVKNCAVFTQDNYWKTDAERLRRTYVRLAQ